jgi:RNA polymerase sigma-70 factor (ECF subfamily)
MTWRLENLEADALFDRIYQAHGKAVLGYALRRTSTDAAQDIAAETFLVAWRRLDDLPKDPLPWLLGVARRLLANQRRGATRAETLRLKLIDAERWAPTDTSQTPIDAPLMQALARLSGSERELLMLVAWEELTPTQAARVLNISAVAARVRLHRAKRRLRESLEIEEGGSLTQLQRTHTAKEAQ